MAGTWTELGIPPTTDPAAIRRAYATRLKTRRPDSDPQGFAALRTAYENALARAARVTPPDPAPEPLQTRPAIQPEPAQTAHTPPDDDALTDCLYRGNPVAAADWLVATRDSGRLTLAHDILLADQLGWHLASDFTLPEPAVRAAAARLAWPREGGTEPWAEPLAARLAAATWLDALRRQSLSPWRWLGIAGPVAARILLGRGRPPFMGCLTGSPALRRRYGEYLLHAPALARMAGKGPPLLDPVRLQGILASLAPQPRRWLGARLVRWPLGLALLPVIVSIAWTIDEDAGLFLLGLLFAAIVLAALCYLVFGWIQALHNLVCIVSRRFRRPPRTEPPA